jgi:hypothetical protein
MSQRTNEVLFNYAKANVRNWNISSQNLIQANNEGRGIELSWDSPLTKGQMAIIYNELADMTIMNLCSDRWTKYLIIDRFITLRDRIMEVLRKEGRDPSVDLSEDLKHITTEKMKQYKVKESLQNSRQSERSETQSVSNISRPASIANSVSPQRVQVPPQIDAEAQRTINELQAELVELKSKQSPPSAPAVSSSDAEHRAEIGRIKAEYERRLSEYEKENGSLRQMVMNSGTRMEIPTSIREREERLKHYEAQNMKLGQEVEELREQLEDSNDASTLRDLQASHTSLMRSRVSLINMSKLMLPFLDIDAFVRHITSTNLVEETERTLQKEVLGNGDSTLPPGENIAHMIRSFIGKASRGAPKAKKQSTND